MSDAATLLTAAGISLPVLGGGIKFIWDKLERRFAHIEAELGKCRAREANASKRAAVKMTVIELLWQEVGRLTGAAPNATLRRAKHLMDELRDLPEDNEELAALAHKLDDAA